MSNLERLNNLKNTEELEKKTLEKTKSILESGSENKNAKTIDKELAEKKVIEHLIERSLRDDIKAMYDVAEKDKQYLRNVKKVYRDEIFRFLSINNIKVRGYDNLHDFVEYMVAEQVGYSVLEEAFADDEISDIYCIDHNTIFVEKAGINMRYPHNFKDEKHYETFIKRLIREDGKEINLGENKKVDFVIYGDRGTATSPAISTKGYSMTIRKHSEDHIVLDQLLETNLMTEEMAKFFELIIDGEANMAYAGITGSGKTTSLRALLDHFVTKNGKRTLVCEDTEELFLKNKHTLAMVSYPSTEPKLEVTLQDVVYMALRQKPKYIVIGEIRGLESQAAIEAMETGHSTMTTMHAGTPLNAVNRLVTKYLEAMPTLSTDIAERIVASALDFVVIQDNIKGIGRRITSITEVNYDFDNKKVILKTIFEYDFQKKDFLLKNRISPDKANHLLRRGQDYDDVQLWTESGIPEIEEQFIKAFNNRYFEQKKAREEVYKKRAKERKLMEKQKSKKENSI